MPAGSAIGSVLGATVGIAAGLPVDTTTQAGGAIGGYIDAMSKKRKARAIMPTDVDPLEQLQLDRLNARTRAIRTGAGQPAMKAIKEALATTVSRSFAGGGRGILNDIDQTFNRAIIGLNQTNNQVLSAYDSLMTDLTNKIAGRKLQLDIWSTSKLEAESAAAEQSADANLGSFLSSVAAKSDAQKEDQGPNGKNFFESMRKKAGVGASPDAASGSTGTESSMKSSSSAANAEGILSGSGSGSAAPATGGIK